MGGCPKSVPTPRRPHSKSRSNSTRLCQAGARVLTAVVEARAKATQIRIDASELTDPDKLREFQQAQSQLSGALGRLLAITENYPELKSNANFLALQSQPEGTENRIAVARRDYIEAVRQYNTALRTFPTVLWAKTAFAANKPMAEFSANANSQSPPQVSSRTVQ